jgi:thiol-disulfide isomerase/thioredoxin
MFLTMLFTVIVSQDLNDQPISALSPENKIYQTYKEAYVEFEQHDKPIFILIWAKWCIPCNDFKKNKLNKILKNTNTQKYSYVEIEDIDPDSSLFMVDKYPYIILYFKQDGVKRSKKFKASDHKELEDLINELTLQPLEVMVK